MPQNYIDSSSDTMDELWHTIKNSDLDEELEMLTRVAMEEERDNLHNRTRVHRCSIQGRTVINRGRIPGSTMTTSVKTLCTLPLNFRGGSTSFS